MAKLKPYKCVFGGELIEIPISVNVHGVFSGRLPYEITNLTSLWSGYTEAPTLDECHAKIREAIQAANDVDKPTVADWIYYSFFSSNNGTGVNGVLISVNVAVVRETTHGKKVNRHALYEEKNWRLKDDEKIDRHGFEYPEGFRDSYQSAGGIKAVGDRDFWGSSSFGGQIESGKANRIPFTHEAWAKINGVVKALEAAYKQLDDLTATPERMLEALSATGPLLLNGE
jgi:hypothetical protein